VKFLVFNSLVGPIINLGALMECPPTQCLPNI
jgi:hypothetical protein